MTDGHATRFDPKVMRFCQVSDINQNLGPPNTTSSTQVLDQIFAMLHAEYNNQRDLLFDQGVNRDKFMHIFAEISHKWAPPERIANAARCGISATGFNVNDMDQAPFERARLLAEAEPSTPKKVRKSSSLTATPEGIRKGTKKNWKYKAETAMAALDELAETPVNPDEVVPDLLSICNEITSIHPSLTAVYIILNCSHFKNVLILSHRFHDVL